MIAIDITEAEKNLKSPVAKLRRGEITEIVLMLNGEAVAKLLPTQAARHLGLLAGKFSATSQDEFDADNDEIRRLFGIENE